VTHLARRWLTAQDEILRDQYTRGAPLAAIARSVGRSEDAVEARRRALGLPPRRTVRSWSAREDALLRAASGAGLPASAVAVRLGRSPDQVRTRRRALGLARRPARPYTNSDDDILRDGWRAGADIDVLARQLDRAPDAVRLRARALGVHRPAARPRWTAAQDAILRDGYTSGMTCARIALLLETRTPTAVAARAQKLGLATFARRWTADEDARLARILHVASVQEAAEVLGRTPEAIRRRARSRRIATGRTRPAPRARDRWTAEEDEILRAHAALNPAVLAALLGRSDHAVVARLCRLGERDLRRRSPHHPSPSRGRLTPGERAVLRREVDARGARALVLLERRLQRPIAELRAASDR
jgi:hypothetical protein